MEFFADALRSISEIEASSQKVAEESNSVKLRNELLPSTHQNQLKNYHSEISSSYKKTDFCDIKNSDDYHDINPDINYSSFVQDENFSTNHRFFPGYTPKAIKRKFPGPAGIFFDEPPRKVSVGSSDVSEIFKPTDLEVEPIKSSQFSVEELLAAPSWNKLQLDVSSNHSFLSNAQNFSVQQVRSDTSKKKLPKHIVVPILCLYIKQFDSEEPVSIYMDDTGEITGKVDKEVLEHYRNYIKTGTSLVLKKITFVCNVMLLEKTNLVSIYLDDGTVHHIQNWDSIVEESLNGCIFPETPKLLKKSGKLHHSKITPTLKQTLNRNDELTPSSGSRTFLPIRISHANVNSPSNSNVINHSNRSIDAANLSHPDLEMDDFDELLGNLDEETFCEDL
ncbi:homologous recombination OB-fold protein isoform X2 [Parasteatoda tepidariorum]|uniref:homologous recombination OB-fold protein isoform X2 n=1 Tax=Parasteatoda tepidariorum TaxID=114398 RepID=UPI00077FB9A5|nr:uncharacterized protein LOC107448801 isoform X2 [Parasteatoda tepidariorum]